MGEKILADLFLVVAEAVLSYTLDKLDPANKVRDWLKRDPAKLAFQKALARSYAAFARHYPDYVASLFDESFLTKEATPEISKLLIRNQHPDPAALAQLWGQSLGANADFAKRATKPASDFLTWLDAELKGEQAFQPLYDSRALDGIEAGIENLSLELRRSLDAALKNAGQYMDLNVGGDIANSVITTGNYNQVNVNHYYSGNFVSLKDFYEAPDAVFKRVRVEEFIGRAWLTTKVKEFLHDPKRRSGAFLIEGEAGVGKSAFMAHLVHTEGYLHLFGEQFSGDSRVPNALRSLGSQIVTRFRLADYEKRDEMKYLSDTSPQFLQRLLQSAAQKLSTGERIVIVCDALDEAGNFPDGNVFGLPDVLPDGVYFILSQRPVPTKLPNIVAETLTLDAQSDENLDDMEAFLGAAAKRTEIINQLRAKHISKETFIRTMKEKSLGVWIYLYYVLDMQNGFLAPLDLDSMPVGLAGYYSKYWGDWRDGRRGEGEQKWDALYAPLLTTLAAAQEAITEEQLRIWAGVQATAREVTRLLRGDWRAFITEREDAEGICLYRPYHLSFRDFLTGKMTGSLPKAQAEFARELADMTIEAHKRIVADYYKQCKGKWEDLAPQTYPRRHLSTHIALAKDFQTLRTLLTEGDERIAWAEEKYKVEETYAGYLADLQPLWKYAENMKDYSLGIRLMLIESSIRSLAANIPPLLLAELAKMGKWSISRCFGVVRQNSNSNSQLRMMELLAPLLSAEQKRELVEIALEIKDPSARASALSALAPHLHDELKPQAFFAACEINDPSVRASALSALAPYLPDELKPKALSAARKINAESARASALSALAPHLPNELKLQVLFATREINDTSARAHVLFALTLCLPDELKSQALQEALSAVYEIKDESVRTRFMSNLAPYLPDKLKLQALSATREIKTGSARARILSALTPHLPNELKPQALQEAISAIREINDPSAHARALSTLVPHLPNELKSQTLQEAFSAAREIKSESTRARILSTLAPHLPEEFKPQALQEAFSATREIKAEAARARILSALVPHLPEELKPQVLSATREIKSTSTRARTLSALAPHLPEELKPHAFSAARKIYSESARASALSALAPYLNDELKSLALQEALSAARKINDESTRASALSTLAPYLNDELKLQTLTATREIKSTSARASTLSALAPHLPNELKSHALSVAREVKAGSARARVLSALAPHLPDELKLQALQEALSTIREIKAESARASALSALAPLLPNELKLQALQEALSATREINDESIRARALSDFPPHLPNELKLQTLQEALSATREINDESIRARALSDFAPHLPNELKLQALSAAREINDESIRASVLSDLATHLPNELKSQALQEALSAACDVNAGYARAVALSALAPHLPDELKFQALSAAREIHDASARASALSTLAPLLPDDLKSQVLQEALSAARKLNDEYSRVRTLTDLAPHLPNELKSQAMQEALSAARKFKTVSARTRALSSLAPHLPDELRSQAMQEALSATREIKAESTRARVLSALTPYLPDELNLQALSAAHEINVVSARARALSALLKKVESAQKVSILEELFIMDSPSLPAIQTVELWKDVEYQKLDLHLFSFMDRASKHNRKKGMDILSALTPALVHFSGGKIIGELLRAIQDTVRWWP